MKITYTACAIWPQALATTLGQARLHKRCCEWGFGAGRDLSGSGSGLEASGIYVEIGTPLLRTDEDMAGLCFWSCLFCGMPLAEGVCVCER